MNWKRFFFEGLAIVVVSVVCATVSNALASRERKLALPGTYAKVTKTTAATSPRASVAPPLDPAAPAGTVTMPPPTTTAPATAITTAAPATTTATPPPTAAKAPGTVAASAAPARATRADLLKRFPPHPDTAYREISGDEAAWLHANGALFLDARRTSVYEQGHVAGAKNYAVWEADIDEKVNNLLNEMPDQDLPIVVYCSGGACEDSHMLAQKLWGVFFTNVLVYKDGWPDWQQRGGASATGS